MFGDDAEVFIVDVGIVYACHGSSRGLDYCMKFICGGYCGDNRRHCIANVVVGW